MDQANGATQDELQQAINSITNGSANAAAGNDVVAQMEQNLTAAAPAAPAAPDAAAAPAPAPEAAAPAAPAVSDIDIEPAKSMYGDPDLDKVKSMALSDLRPLLEKVDIAADKKFMIYRDIIELTEDKACIEPAYNCAKQIEDEKTKGEALVFVVECIDKLGIQLSE